MASSQDTTTGTPFFHAPNGVGYRLLELPPELVAEGSHPWHLESDGDDLARLRTAAGRTYSLRQKNTSNALLLLSVQDGATSGNAGEMTQPSLAAVATLHETVELVEETAPSGPVVAAPKTAAPARGRWHEKFGKTR